MTQASRQVTDFGIHLDTRLDELAAAPCDDQPFGDFLRNWIAKLRGDIREYCDADRYTLEEPKALVHLGGESNDGPGHRYHLTSNIVADQVIRWELDVDLTTGSTVQLTDIGPHPVNILCRIITSYDVTYVHRNHTRRTPVVTGVLFQANVHCPDCQEFGCHRVSIPITPWGGWVWRRCGACRHPWRQHPQGV